MKNKFFICTLSVVITCLLLIGSQKAYSAINEKNIIDLISKYETWTVRMLIPDNDNLGKTTKTPDYVKNAIGQREQKNVDELFPTGKSNMMKDKVDSALNSREVLNDVDGGVVNIVIKQCNIKDDTALVEAQVTKFITNIVNKDGKSYKNRVQSTDMKKYNCIRENGKWVIDNVSGQKDFDSVQVDLQPIE
ncbi:MAG: hypothetical protein A4E55_00337 [Pelotomaculum sp. PtaU1.Bin035]|nr:MAG: hypothetical protein A4E55_00337 [Pelotomaculum sp. PtaU1.Bin035]